MANKHRYNSRIGRVGMVGATLAIAGAIAALEVTPLTAQAAYKAANGHSSIIPRKYGMFTADFAEIRLGLTFTGEWGTWCDYGECDFGGFGFTAYGSAAGRKGQGDLFADFDFAPGFEAGGRTYYAFGQNGTKYDLVYLTLGYVSQQLRLAELDPVTTVLRFDERYMHKAVADVGYNHNFGGGTAVGLRAEGRREYGSVGPQRPEEICVPASFQGIPTGGLACSNRYLRNTFEPLPDLWAGHVRADVTLGIVSFGSAPSVPTLGLVAAASGDFWEGYNAAVNFSLGAAIHSAGFPGQSFVTLLFGVNDAFNANDQTTNFSQRFVTSFILGIPFAVIIQ